ncbi:hypothetical protein ACFLXT_04305 [Chloroflexota bacterium]
MQIVIKNKKPKVLHSLNPPQIVGEGKHEDNFTQTFAESKHGAERRAGELLTLEISTKSGIDTRQELAKIARVSHDTIAGVKTTVTLPQTFVEVFASIYSCYDSMARQRKSQVCKACEIKELTLQISAQISAPITHIESPQLTQLIAKGKKVEDNFPQPLREPRARDNAARVKTKHFAELFTFWGDFLTTPRLGWLEIAGYFSPKLHNMANNVKQLNIGSVGVKMGRLTSYPSYPVFTKGVN